MPKSKFKIMIARFPTRNEHPSEVNWLLDMEKRCVKDDRVESLSHFHVTDTPTPMCRNLAVKVAMQHNMDILLMVDDDMGPDLDNPETTFWEVAFPFIVSRWDKAPTIIAAPYCSAPPTEDVLVFRWEQNETDNPNPDYKICRYSRTEGAVAKGVESVAALPTGLIAFDMRVFTGFSLPDGRTIKLTPPFFYYEWTDEYQTAKASTEDVVTTRNASLLFAKYGLEVCFVSWDTWAEHYKIKRVSKPKPFGAGNLAKIYGGLTHG